jgi:hypothetical protein
VIKFFEQAWGADRISLAAEVGAVWLGGMDPNVNYGRSSAYGANTFEPFNSHAAAPARTAADHRCADQL